MDDLFQVTATVFVGTHRTTKTRLVWARSAAQAEAIFVAYYNNKDYTHVLDDVQVEEVLSEASNY